MSSLKPSSKKVGLKSIALAIRDDVKKDQSDPTRVGFYRNCDVRRFGESDRPSGM